MTAVDRFLAICHPLTNQVWTSKTSKQMVLAAWVISIVLSLPQAFVFSSPEGTTHTCQAGFAHGWGVKVKEKFFNLSKMRDYSFTCL